MRGALKTLKLVILPLICILNQCLCLSLYVLQRVMSASQIYSISVTSPIFPSLPGGVELNSSVNFSQDPAHLSITRCRVLDAFLNLGKT